MVVVVVVVVVVPNVCPKLVTPLSKRYGSSGATAAGAAEVARCRALEKYIQNLSILKKGRMIFHHMDPS